ncbi:MAG: D-glycerate dehydrogenase [Deferribacterota bacterium]|nr:D-glycerate dehydrogenase [Deferribacterota bacterium]
MKILITQKLPINPKKHLNDFNLIYNENSFPIKESDLLNYIEDVSGIVSTIGTKLNRELLEKSSNLKIIANYGVGYDNIDIDFAKEKNIIVTNTPYVLTESTAELAITLMLNIARKVLEANKYLIDGEFKGWQPTLFLGDDLYKKTVGIFGFGRIGQRVAQILNVFSCNTIYNSRTRKIHEEQLLNATFVSFEDMLINSDFIIITAPKSKDTFHRFTINEFQKMKKTSYIINVGRGDIIKEDDLIYALKNRFISGAALDVYEKEPHIPDELKNLKNTVLLPHIGSATFETRKNMALLCFDSIKKVLLDRKKPWNAVF